MPRGRDGDPGPWGNWVKVLVSADVVRHDAAVPRRRLLAVVSITVATATLAACGAAPGEAAARDACTNYANTMRHQVATTVQEADAIRATARSDAKRAAAADPQWQALQHDIGDFYARQSKLSQQSAVDEVNAYFAADRRVQADCTAAGEDIGPLRP